MSQPLSWKWFAHFAQPFLCLVLYLILNSFILWHPQTGFFHPNNPFRIYLNQLHQEKLRRKLSNFSRISAFMLFCPDKPNSLLLSAWRKTPAKRQCLAASFGLRPIHHCRKTKPRRLSPQHKFCRNLIFRAQYTKPDFICTDDYCLFRSLFLKR